MPEMPEVETIRRAIVAHLPLHIIKQRTSQHLKSMVKAAKIQVTGQTITSISRHGKFLDIKFDSGCHLISHFGMSGGWEISRQPIKKKHTHIQFNCTDSAGLSWNLGYVDPRRFGKFYFVQDSSEKLSKLGPDILDKDNFSVNYLAGVFARKGKLELKPLLLDQSLVAGIGNYMASEICALAGILPTRKAGAINATEAGKIYVAIFQVVAKSLKAKGLSFHGGYRDANGDDGKAKNSLVVFHQSNCRACQTKVKRLKQKGRATFYCPSCQK
jgi:formamidopyrimidine-DNA glycosylase